MNLSALLGGLPAPVVVLLIGAMPIFEVRGAIPAAVALKMPLGEAYLWACLGNLLPVAPVLLFLNPVSSWLRRFPLWAGFFQWLFARTEKKAAIVRRYEALGLALFVMIPLPLTGAWTGCAAASLFKLPFRLAFPAIALGVLGAGVLVAGAMHLGLTLFYSSLGL